MDNLKKLAGGYGSKTLHGTTDYTSEQFIAIVVTADAVFSNLEESMLFDNGSPVVDIDVLGATEQNKTGVTIPAGSILYPKREVFSRVKLTSGTCEAYKG